ncbi:hypothetical protein AZA_06011 [Nitrospirillum viridazoti Y2]|nr:hypothetical protein AZA_06011 [Nitrospirillum amazonense Y2]
MRPPYGLPALRHARFPLRKTARLRRGWRRIVVVKVPLPGLGRHRFIWRRRKPLAGISSPIQIKTRLHSRRFAAVMPPDARTLAAIAIARCVRSTYGMRRSFRRAASGSSESGLGWMGKTLGSRVSPLGAFEPLVGRTSMHPTSGGRMFACSANAQDSPPANCEGEASVSLRAFLGDPALKAETLSRVLEGWKARQIIPLLYLKWSSDAGVASLAGTIAQTQDPGLFVTRTGLPLELALLCEILINTGITFEDDETSPRGFVMSGDERIWSFGIEWLEAIAVDDDVSDVVTRFLPVFMKQILSDDCPLAGNIVPAVRVVAQEMLQLWGCESRGEPVPSRAWRTVRANALHASEGSSDPAGYAVADLVESLAWPSAGIATELPAISQKFLQSCLQVLAAKFLPQQDQTDWIKSQVAHRELRRARSEAQYASLSDEDLLDHRPEIKQAILALQHPEVAARMGAAKENARTQMVPFLRQQMDGILNLLRRKSDGLASA